jgi:hypothetical protein
MLITYLREIINNCDFGFIEVSEGSFWEPSEFYLNSLQLR